MSINSEKSVLKSFTAALCIHPLYWHLYGMNMDDSLPIKQDNNVIICLSENRSIVYFPISKSGEHSSFNLLINYPHPPIPNNNLLGWPTIIFGDAGWLYVAPRARLLAPLPSQQPEKRRWYMTVEIIITKLFFNCIEVGDRSTVE